MAELSFVLIPLTEQILARANRAGQRRGRETMIETAAARPRRLARWQSMPSREVFRRIVQAEAVASLTADRRDVALFVRRQYGDLPRAAVVMAALELEAQAKVLAATTMATFEYLAAALARDPSTGRRLYSSADEVRTLGPRRHRALLHAIDNVISEFLTAHPELVAREVRRIRWGARRRSPRVLSMMEEMGR